MQCYYYNCIAVFSVIDLTYTYCNIVTFYSCPVLDVLSNSASASYFPNSEITFPKAVTIPRQVRNIRVLFHTKLPLLITYADILKGEQTFLMWL